MIEQHKPGQWVDLHIPSLARPGGFTITSTPYSADSSRAKAPHIDLAVQTSTISPAAEWLWHEQEDIMGKELSVRVGGSFVWQSESKPRQVLFVAGGVGINPLMSMLRHLEATDAWPAKVTFVYSTKAPQGDMRAERVLFLDELIRLQDASGGRLEVKLFITGTHHQQAPAGFPAFSRGRVSTEALADWVEDARETMAYVCGPPAMTDEVVETLRKEVGMAEGRVLCEKWW
jgi:NAD(P)H-flavin reductase